MTILVDQNSKFIVQGITGRIGSFQTKIMLDYGTKIVAGVTPGKGGQTIHGIPVYDLVEEATKVNSIDASIIFVPGSFAMDAVFEALEAGIKFTILIPEGIPNQDAIRAITYAKERRSIILGPDTPGIISPGKCKAGVHPHRMFKEGHVGVMSRSGALSYETCKTLTEANIGQSTVVGIGGGPIWGLTEIDVLKLFAQDDQTKCVVLLGEIGSTMEEQAAEYIADKFEKPVVALIVGRFAPEGERMGHAGAIIQSGKGNAQEKIKAMKKAGALIAKHPRDIPSHISSFL